MSVMMLQLCNNTHTLFLVVSSFQLELGWISFKDDCDSEEDVKGQGQEVNGVAYALSLTRR